MARTISEALAPYQMDTGVVKLPVVCNWGNCLAVGVTLCYGEWLCLSHRDRTIARIENSQRRDTLEG